LFVLHADQPELFAVSQTLIVHRTNTVLLALDLHFKKNSPALSPLPSRPSPHEACRSSSGYFIITAARSDDRPKSSIHPPTYRLSHTNQLDLFTHIYLYIPIQPLHIFVTNYRSLADTFYQTHRYNECRIARQD
jgi:hypothetical protein